MGSSWVDGGAAAKVQRVGCSSLAPWDHRHVGVASPAGEAGAATWLPVADDGERIAPGGLTNWRRVECRCTSSALDGAAVGTYLS